MAKVIGLHPDCVLFGWEMCEALGLDPARVRSFTVRCGADSAAEVVVEQYMEDTHLRAMTAVVRRFRIAAVEVAEDSASAV